MASSSTSNVYIQVMEDVMNKVRDEFINNGGGQGERVLNELQGLWKQKMMEAGAVLGPNPIDRSAPRPPSSSFVNQLELGREEGERGAPHQPTRQDLLVSSGKRKRDYHSGGYIPQQDGAGDHIELLKLAQGETSSSRIPHKPEPYTTTPNIYNYQGVVKEEYMPAATPDSPVENEIGDEDDLDEVDQGEDLNTTHLVMAQFDKVTRTSKTGTWKCTFKDGIMHINNKDILFNKATGEFFNF